MAANTLYNLSGFSDGVAADEEGINIEEFKTEVEPEFIKNIPSKNGTVRGSVIAPMKKVVSIQGEVSGDTGVMAATAYSAFAPANSTAWFGAPTTDLLLTKADVTENRNEGELRKMSATFDAYAGRAD